MASRTGGRARRAMGQGGRAAGSVLMAALLTAMSTAAAAEPPVSPAAVPVSAPMSADPVISQEQAMLTASDPFQRDMFGGSVAVEGDTAVVGAGNFDNAEQAYVFTRTGDTWTEQAILNGPVSEFGYSVDISGETIVVGAPGAFDHVSSNVTVFVRDGATWTVQAVLEPDDPWAGIGRSVAIDGDTVISDGYVFVRTATTWAQQAALPLSNFSFFGATVAIDGDTVLIARDDVASVFVRTGSTWAEQATLAPGGSFVNAVALSGDTAVTAYSGDGGAAAAGFVYVFVRSGATWSEQAFLTAPDAQAHDMFGSSVAVQGDTLVVGAWGDDTGPAVDAGSAYVFTRSDGTWLQRAKLHASDAGFDPDADGGDGFGGSVSLDDGTAIIGAPFDSNAGGFDAGSAYVFVAAPVPVSVGLDGIATLAGGGRTVSLPGVIVCPAGERFTIAATVRQFAATGSGRAVGMCTGSVQAFTAKVRAAGGARFTTEHAVAFACVTATAGSPAASADTCRTVSIADP